MRCVIALAALALIPAAASAATPVPDRIQPPAGNAPFLLVHAIGVQVCTCASTADGPTTYIQRLATRGGTEPAAATCHAGTVGKQRWVPYTADYRFFKEQS